MGVLYLMEYWVYNPIIYCGIYNPIIYLSV